MTRIVRKAVAAQQNNNRARGGIGSDRQIFHSEFNQLFAEELATYDLEAVVPITYAEAQTAITNSTLVAGTHYKLTDKADGGIILLAVALNQFSLEGQGIFLNPDFQGVGVLGADIKGVWYVGGEASWVNGDIVFWDGLHYEVTDSGAFDGINNPDTNVAAYTLLTKSIVNGYIEEVDFILYDFANDGIIRRIDKRGNDVGKRSVSTFQWGNNDVERNEETSHNFNCINQRGYIRDNIIKGNLIRINNTHEGEVSNCELAGDGIIYANFNSSTYMSNCRIYSSLNITFDSTSIYENKEINSLRSNFEAELDMTDGDDYTAATDTLTIPTNLNYVGIFNLVDCAAQPIVKIANLPGVGEIEFRVATAADTVVFTNTAIGLAVADNLVADVVGINTLTGRLSGDDFIRYRKSGTLNVRTTGSIMA